MSIDPRWPVLGRTGNATFHLAAPRIIVVVPDEGCTDDADTARQSIAFQQAHWKDHGTSGAAVVLMDRVVHQTKDARRVYQEEVDIKLITGFGLVSKSVFGRAVASVFLGLARPAIPTRMFDGLASALRWAESRHIHEGPQAQHQAGPEDGDAT
jgi:hypothetical protein